MQHSMKTASRNARFLAETCYNTIAFRVTEASGEISKILMKNTKLTQAELDIYEAFELCGKNAKKWMQKCVLMLPNIE